MGSLSGKMSDKIGDMGMSSLSLSSSPGLKRAKDGKEGDKKKGLLGKMKW